MQTYWLMENSRVMGQVNLPIRPHHGDVIVFPDGEGGYVRFSVHHIDFQPRTGEPSGMQTYTFDVIGERV